MASFAFPGSLPANQFQAQAPNEGFKAGTGLSEPGEDGSTFPAMLEDMVGARPREDGEATPRDTGLPAEDRRLASDNARGAFPAPDRATPRTRVAGDQTPVEGAGREAGSPAVPVPDGKQAVVGGGRQVAHGSPPMASPVLKRRGKAPEEQAAGLPAAPAAEQRVAETKGRLAAELALTAEPNVLGEAAPNPSIAARLSESPTEALAIGLQLQAAALLSASKASSTPPTGRLPAAVPASNSLATHAVPQSVLETSARKSSKSVLEEAPPLDPPDPEPTGTAPSAARQVHDQPVAAPPDNRSKLPEAGAARAAVPLLETASDSPSTTGENGGSVDAKVRIMALGTPDRGDVAFQVQVQAMATRPAAPTEAVRLESPAKLAAAEEQRATRPAQVPELAPAVTGKAAAGSGDGDGTAAGHERRHGEADRAYRSAPAHDSPSNGMAEVPAAKATQWGPSGAMPQEAPLAETAAAEARPAQLGELAKVEPKSEIQPAPAREIKLEVTGAEGRVEVRISDRGGEVRVAVRTPDHQLAGTLRDNLPELATRLAETGLRGEIWHPAGSPAGEGRHTADMAAGNLAQDADSQSRGQGNQQGNPQGDAQERHRKNFAEQQQTHKDKREDFAWLMSSLR